MARFSRKEKAAIFFNVHGLMTRKIMHSRDAQCNTGGMTLSVMDF